MIHARAEEAAPASYVRRSASTSTLSRRLWQLSWAAVMPPEIDGIAVEIGSFAEAYPFVEEHWAAIFGDDAARFHVEELTEAKRRFWDEMDVFVFRADGRIAGIAAGHPTDWSTYYMRTFALLPEFRERRFASAFGEHMSRALREAGVARLEAETSVANVAMSRLLASQGFLISSMLASERWGVMLRFTKYLDGEAESVFRRQFVNVPAYGKRVSEPQRRKP